MKQVDKDTIEEIIDRYSVSELLTAVAEICGEKAEHLRTAWQDNVAARTWDKDSTRITSCCHGIQN